MPEIVLTPNHTYILGEDCDYGYYIIVSKSVSKKAEFNQYPSFDKSGLYYRDSCYFGCVKISRQIKCVTISYGKAFSVGTSPFDLYEDISKVSLPDGKFF